ncbi:hypothetical protein KCU67_g72, partial [Aureobasidium melanogenum]
MGFPKNVISLAYARNVNAIVEELDVDCLSEVIDFGNGHHELIRGKASFSWKQSLSASNLKPFRGKSFSENVGITGVDDACHVVFILQIKHEKQSYSMETEATFQLERLQGVWLCLRFYFPVCLSVFSLSPRSRAVVVVSIRRDVDEETKSLLVVYVSAPCSCKDLRLPLCEVIIREQLLNVLSGPSDIAGIVNSVWGGGSHLARVGI